VVFDAVVFDVTMSVKINVGFDVGALVTFSVDISIVALVLFTFKSFIVVDDKVGKIVGFEVGAEVADNSDEFEGRSTVGISVVDGVSVSINDG